MDDQRRRDAERGHAQRRCRFEAEGAASAAARSRLRSAVNSAGAVRGNGVGSLKSAKTMKEAYAVRRTVPPSAEIEARIEQMLSVGVGENPRETLSELARLGARLIIQRAVEDEFDAWLGRARYERRPLDQREERSEESGMRNGFRPRTAADRGRRASGRDPAGPSGGGDVRVEAVPADSEAGANGAVEGVGDRRVRPRPLDA